MIFLKKTIAVLSLVAIAMIMGGCFSFTVEMQETTSPACTAAAVPGDIQAVRDYVALLDARYQAGMSAYKNGTSSAESLWELRLKLDKAKLMQMRIEENFCPEAGLAEAFLQWKYEESNAERLENVYKFGSLSFEAYTEARIAASEARLAYLGLLRKLCSRAAFEQPALGAYKGYPGKIVTDSQLRTLLQLEAAGMNR